MKRGLVLFTLLAAISIHAQPLLERGDVVAQGHSYNPLQSYPPPGDYVDVAGSGGAPKPLDALLNLPKYIGRNGLLFLGVDHALSWRDRDLQEWREGNGVNLFALRLKFPDSGLGLSGGEILQTRGGDFLIAEYGRVGLKPRIVRFTLNGEVVQIHEIPDAPLLQTMPAQYDGVAHMDLLSDQCTLLWSSNAIDRYQVHVFDLCASAAKPLFLNAADFDPSDDRIDGIRALPNGDLLLATPIDVRRYDRAGRKIATYEYPEDPEYAPLVATQTFIALTPDATGFWVGRNTLIQRIDFASPSAPAVTFKSCHCVQLFAVTVVGEWRAALQPPPVPKRRSAR